MTDNFEGWRVTALMRPKYSFGHNLRLPDYVELKNILILQDHMVLFFIWETKGKLLIKSLKMP